VQQRLKGNLILFGLLPGIAVPLLVLLIAATTSIDIIPTLMSDPTHTLDVSPLTGFVSSLGVFVWIAVTAICTFSSRLLHARGETESSRFLAIGAAITAYVAFDDYFRVHEFILPSIGVAEKYVYLTLGTGVVVYLYLYRALVLLGPVINLALALLLLGLSVVIDTIHERMPHWSDAWLAFGEDSCKWMGLIFWAGYFIEMAFILAGRVLKSQGAALISNDEPELSHAGAPEFIQAESETA